MVTQTRGGVGPTQTKTLPWAGLECHIFAKPMGLSTSWQYSTQPNKLQQMNMFVMVMMRIHDNV